MGLFKNWLTAIVIIITIILLLTSQFLGKIRDTAGINITGIPPSWLIMLVAILIIIIIRKPRQIFRIIKKLVHRKSRSNWERINKMPHWAIRKMRRRNKNRVNGEHYQYMKNHGKYYRRLR